MAAQDCRFRWSVPFPSPQDGGYTINPADAGRPCGALRLDQSSIRPASLSFAGAGGLPSRRSAKALCPNRACARYGCARRPRDPSLGPDRHAAQGDKSFPRCFIELGFEALQCERRILLLGLVEDVRDEHLVFAEAAGFGAFRDAAHRLGEIGDRQRGYIEASADGAAGLTGVLANNPPCSSSRLAKPGS